MCSRGRRGGWEEGRGLRAGGDGCAVAGVAELGAGGPVVSSKLELHPRGLWVPWKVLMQKNAMSRCIKQHLLLQMAEMGSGQLKTQTRFMERCDRTPGWKGGQGSRASGGQASASRGGTEMRQHHPVQLPLSPRSSSVLRGTNLWPIHTADCYPPGNQRKEPLDTTWANLRDFPVKEAKEASPQGMQAARFHLQEVPGQAKSRIGTVAASPGDGSPRRAPSCTLKICARHHA